MNLSWLFPGYLPLSQPPEYEKVCDNLPFFSSLVKFLRPKRVVDWKSGSPNAFFSLCHAVLMTETKADCLAWGDWNDQEIRWSEKYQRSHFSGIASLFTKSSDNFFNALSDGSIDLLHLENQFYRPWISKVAKGGLVIIDGMSISEWHEISLLGPSFLFPAGKVVGVVAPRVHQHDLLFELNQKAEFYRAHFEQLDKALKTTVRLRRKVRQQKQMLCRIVNHSGFIKEKAGLLELDLARILGTQGQIHYSLGSLEKKIDIIASSRTSES